MGQAGGEQDSVRRSGSRKRQRQCPGFFRFRGKKTQPCTLREPTLVHTVLARQRFQPTLSSVFEFAAQQGLLSFSLSETVSGIREAVWIDHLYHLGGPLAGWYRYRADRSASPGAKGSQRDRRAPSVELDARLRMGGPASDVTKDTSELLLRYVPFVESVSSLWNSSGYNLCEHSGQML
jgi:hypothetical protein